MVELAILAVALAAATLVVEWYVWKRSGVRVRVWVADVGQTYDLDGAWEFTVIAFNAGRTPIDVIGFGIDIGNGEHAYLDGDEVCFGGADGPFMARVPWGGQCPRRLEVGSRTEFRWPTLDLLEALRGDEAISQARPWVLLADGSKRSGRPGLPLK